VEVEVDLEQRLLLEFLVLQIPEEGEVGLVQMLLEQAPITLEEQAVLV
jgi:hypothetical protein